MPLLKISIIKAIIIILSNILFLSITFAEQNFDIVHIPPTLINPTEVVLSRTSPTSNIVQYGACGPGKVYSLHFSDNEDALVTFDDTQALPYPVHIAGGKNVIIKGLDIELVTQVGNEVGSLIQVTQTYNQTNPHPAVPACGGLRLSPSNATHWVEGLNLDTKGHNADAIIVNAPSTPGTSKIVIQNSLIRGIEGSLDLHGDILQTQSGHLGTLIFENVTMRQALEGVVLSYPVDNVIMRNVDYDTDPRFDSDDAWDDIIVGGFFAGDRVQNSYSLENIFIKYKNPNTGLWFLIKDKHFSSLSNANKEICLFSTCLTTETHPEVHYQKAPPQGDFALTSQVGSNYQSSVLVDTKAPTAPSNLKASNITQTNLDLNWSVSTDNTGVKEYFLFQDEIKINTTDKTNLTVNNLSPNTTYSFRVKAIDNAGNESLFSNYETAVTDEVTSNFTLNYTAESGGHIEGASNQTVNKDSSGSSVTAIADDGYSFKKWSDGLTTASRTDANITADMTLIASFTENSDTTDTTFSLTYLAGNGGRVEGVLNQIVKKDLFGSLVRAVADEGYVFNQWSDGVTTAVRVENHVTENKTYTASFITADKADFDKDGIPDITDTDDDNDGFSDEEEIEAGTNPLDSSNKPENSDSNSDSNSKNDSDSGSKDDSTKESGGSPHPAGLLVLLALIHRKLRFTSSPIRLSKQN